jgi:TIR domain-containing protein
MAYQYDVFLSYNRKYPHGKWVNETFYPFFKSYLEDALNIKEVKIFKDTDDIKSGQAWPAKIKNALIHSRILVCILSPAYFHSEWCKKEFAIIDYRQRQCGYMTTENPNGLIVPIKIFDGEHFPEYVNDELQIDDFNRFLRIGIELAATPLYIEFQDRLIAWVDSVAHAYNHAPPWNNNWVHPDWIEESWRNLDQLSSTSSKKPPKL